MFLYLYLAEAHYSYEIRKKKKKKLTRCEEDGNQTTNGLRVPLLDGRGAQQKSSSEIARQRRGDVSSTGSQTTGDEVDALRMLDGVSLVRGSTAENKLTGFRSSRQRGLIRHSTYLDSQEGKHEGEDAGQDGQAGVHAPLVVEDKDTSDNGNDETAGPHPDADLVFRSRRILNHVLGTLDLGSGLPRKIRGMLAPFNKHVVDGHTSLLPD